MRTVLFVVLAAVAACTPKDKASGGERAKCTSVGQTCEFSPGKLGTCVARDDCTSDCFVCQSQH
jgi:hypothetical protein